MATAKKHSQRSHYSYGKNRASFGQFERKAMIREANKSYKRKTTLLSRLGQIFRNQGK